MILLTGTGMSCSGISSEKLLIQAKVALAKGDYATAEREALEVLDRLGTHGEALLVAGQAAAGLGDLTKALQYFDRISDDKTQIAVQARFMAGDLLLLKSHELTRAEQQFQRAVRMDDCFVPAQERLAYVLGLASRSWEAIPHRIQILKQGEESAAQVYALCLGDRVLENPEVVGTYLEANPTDAAALLGQGRVFFEVKRYVEAERLLRAAMRADSRLVQAAVWLGRTLEACGDSAALENWHAELSPAADDHPGIWFLRGLWSKQRAEQKVAARCFWEAVRLDPNHAQSNYHLGQMLVALNRSVDAEDFLRRARLLEQYAKAAEVAYHTRSLPELEKTMKLAKACGLFHEAVGWCHVALSSHNGHLPAQRMIDQLSPRLAESGLQRAIPESNPALQIDLSDMPLPRSVHQSPAAEVLLSERGRSTVTTFADMAADSGLDFRYFNSGEPRTQGIVMMYEVVGGGSAVLDFDCDGWPDLHFAQGCRWPPQPEQREHLDYLFRNTGDGAFIDVAESAGIVENRFSQGATVGDFNQDGFPDLYINNIGPNRLYRNNGDGTFSDVTAETGTAGDDYSVSSVMADLNGDNWPDIYVVNYLSGGDLFTKVCGDNQGVRASCLPQLFPAAQDRLYLNLGDGMFREVTREAGLILPDGKGLGVVAADFDGSGRLSLFIANDVAPNFFLVNSTPAPGEIPTFREEGLARGLALDYSGQQESCMGIAAGDADGDGLLDLFVTNFDNETHTLYHQHPGCLFEDATIRAGLDKKEGPYVGWGTQFVDGDLDGDLDLVITNGHINDLTPKGRPYQMPPQYFQNLGEGVFELQAAATVGDFFLGNYLGRGMTRLDWNRDGREDLAISHLDAPAALLTNTTRAAGNSVILRFVGVESPRDAVGTTIKAVAAGRTWVRQLTAGDGNQASNERVIILGIGAATSIETLIVRWPSGQEQAFSELATGGEYLFIEGRGQPIQHHK